MFCSCCCLSLASFRTWCFILFCFVFKSITMMWLDVVSLYFPWFAFDHFLWSMIFFLTNFRRKFGNFRRKYGDIDYSCSVLTHFFLGESSFKCFELVNIFPQVSEHSCFLIKKTLLLFRSSNFFCYLFYFIFCFIAI